MISHEHSAKNYGRGAGKAVGESTGSQRRGYHANGADGIAACRSFTNVFAIAGAAWESQILTNGGGPER